MRPVSHRGFTLIELLVVIAIIGLLSAVILASLSSARQKADDTYRKASLKELQTALELYYNNHGAYPSTGGSWFGTSPNGGSRTDWIPGLVADGDISALPQDPVYMPNSCDGWGGTFLYMSNGADYKVLSSCPYNSILSPSDAFYDPVRPGWSWQVSSPGGVGW